MYYETDCRKCPEKVHCCINGFAFLTHVDALKIKKKIKLPYDEFIDYSPLDKQTLKMLKDDDPSLEGALRYSQLDKQKRILRIKKKEGRCFFLDGNGKCKIYAIRPNICKIYPFWAMRLLNGRIKIIEHDEDTGCSIIKGKDIDKILTEKQKDEIKNIFRKIEEEKAGRAEF